MMGWKDWRFTLILDQDVDALDEINWEALLPVAGVTCWLSFDFAARRLEIEPGVAVPDLE